MLKKCSYRIVGVSPLIMHSAQLADPSNMYSRAIKEISSKRKKVEADYEEMARLEWLGALYLHEGAPCIPGYVLEAALIGKGGASRKVKAGKEVMAGLFVVNNFPLEYEGLRDVNELWKDEQFRLQVSVKVGQARIMRTRPIFNEWAADVAVEIDLQIVDEATLGQWMETAGYKCGLMDWRPKFGRFNVEHL